MVRSAVLAGICAVVFAVAAGAANESPVVALGRAIFADPALSSSGRMSCATCHDPAHAHAQPNGFAVQPGGSALDVPGFRTVPSLRYMNTTPFAFDDEGTPSGGFNRDGRAASLIEQANRPFLAPHEMANLSPADLAQRLINAPYADDFRRAFGKDVFADPEKVIYRAQFAIAAFERSAPELHPFDSKYDLFLKGKVRLSDAELRGLALFNRRDKGNCAACHPSPLFTDFTYDNLGVPRNANIDANRDPAYYDLGVCGPFREDMTARRDLCGAFKVPTLRNVATRSVFFHNGRFTSLTDAVRFYVRRDTNPEEFYPVVDGVVQKFDDLPPELHGNVNTSEAPYDRQPGDAPRLSEDEIRDVVAFLHTLTDGYDRSH